MKKEDKNGLNIEKRITKNNKKKELLKRHSTIVLKLIVQALFVYQHQ
jgi:hypothetical protein